MTALFTKRELQAQLESIDIRITKIKDPLVPTLTIEEGERNQADLQKLNAARSDLLERMKVAPE
jgi:hypothetical protein